MNQDAEHLRLLSIFYYIKAGLVAFSSLFALLYVCMGLAFAVMGATVPIEEHPVRPPVEHDHGFPAESPPGREFADDASAPPFPAQPPRDRPGHQQEAPPAALFAAFGLMFACIGMLGLVIAIAYATALFLTARYLARRTHRLFCLIVAGLACANMPLGTILGVFTFIVLLRPSVAELFEGRPVEVPPQPTKNKPPF